MVKLRGREDRGKDKEGKILKKRRRRVFLKRIWGFFRLFLILVFFGGCIKGMNYFYNSDYFKVKTVMIEGNSHYSQEEIRKELDKIVGENIFEIEKKNIEEKLLKNLAWLKEVQMDKVFPDKVNIKVVERKPYIKIEYKNRFYILDNEGVVLEEVAFNDLKQYKELLLVKNVVDYYPTSGEKIAKKNVLSCAKIYLLLSKEVKERIRNAMVTDNVYGDIVFLTLDNKKIIFGNSENAVEKCRVLEQILIQLSEEEYKYDIIDLRNFKTPVVK